MVFSSKFSSKYDLTRTAPETSARSPPRECYDGTALERYVGLSIAGI